MLAGVKLVPDLSGAVYMRDYETLIISDLHLEQGSSLARRGIHIPPFDTAVTLTLLETVVAETAPKRLIFLGDSFHDSAGEDRLSQESTERLRSLTTGYETLWIIGNHDPLPPERLGGQGAEQIALGPLTLRHEPSQKLDGEVEIAGHLHPGCGLSQRGRRIYGKCFVSDETRLIMPAFGAYTGGLSITSDAFGGLLDRKTAHAHMIGRAALHKFPIARLS